MKKFFSRMKKRPTAFISFIILILLYFGMFLAEFLSPYNPTDIFKNHCYYPPNIILYSGKYGLGLQIRKYALINQMNWRYAPLKGEYYPVHFFVHGPEYKLWGLISTDIHLFGVDMPYDDMTETWENGGRNQPVFLFGSDHQGRDLFSRVLYGSRISLTIGFIGISISLFIAIALGGLAGYYGGRIDWLIMRFAEFFILIPGLYLILFLRSILSRNLDSGQSFILITVILSFVSWPGTSRIIRGMVHAIKREDFILCAQIQGIPSFVIIFKQIIPQISSILIVWVTLGIPGFILGETALSYLGLGIVDPAVSWGVLINREVTSPGNLMNFPWFLIPGVYLILTTVSFSFIGDLLRDMFDPYHSERRRKA